MSVLTKIFIVLLVVVSLLMAAGQMVFVNRMEDFNKKVADSKAAEVKEREGRIAAEQATAAAEGTIELARYTADERIKPLQAQVLAAEQNAKTAAAQLASVNEENAKMKSDVAAANAAVAASTATIGEQQKVINATANDLRAVSKDKADLQTQVAANIREIEGLRASNRRQKEEIATLSAKLNDVMSNPRTTSQAGTGRENQPGATAAVPPVNGPFLNLRGVVKARKNINGVDYATISLGATQKVEKGMRFYVTDNANFLGYLTVDLVETDQSVGHLEGPSLNMVRPGSEVRTQW